MKNMKELKSKLKGVMAITPPVVADRAAWLGMIEAVLHGGIRLLQLRLKPATPLQMLIHGRRVLDLVRRYDALLIVNDFPDVAIAIGADGVHLGRDDPRVQDVRRRYGSDLIIGASAYCDLDLALSLQHQGADYVGFSTPFASRTKPGAPDCPLTNVSRLVQALKIPVFLVGGIGLENQGIVRETKVAGVAVSWGLFGADEPEAAARVLTESWSG